GVSFDGSRVSKTNGSRQEVEFVLAPNKAQVDEINNGLCMVENFLGERLINFSTRESTLLSLWRLIQAAHIKPIGDNGSYIIHFFQPVDLKKMPSGGLWYLFIYFGSTIDQIREFKRHLFPFYGLLDSGA
ncbi:hypothetical protein Gorai_007629, partial [Gossypium raimondii]|nr:hypothetical protein [Gossypium raimondii]